MTKAKPFDIPKREVWEAFKNVKANQGAAGVDGQSIADFEAGLAEQPLQALEPAVVGQLHASAGAAGGHTEGDRAARDRWAFRRSPIVSRKRLSADTWSRVWNLCSTRTPTAIGPAARRSTRSARRASGAGATTGCSTSTSRASSTASHELLLQGRAEHIRVPLGAALRRTLVEGADAEGRRQSSSLGMRERRRAA